MANDQLLEKISQNIEQINSRLSNLENGQASLNGDAKLLKKGQEELRGDIQTLQKGQEELRSDVQTLQKGQEELKKTTRSMKIKLNRAAKDISYMVKTFDQGIVDNSRRIIRIEDHLDLPPFKN